MFSLPLTKWQAVSKVVNKLSKTNVFALFVRKPVMQKPKRYQGSQRVWSRPQWSLSCRLPSPVTMEWFFSCQEALGSGMWAPLQIQGLIPPVPMLSLSVSLVLAGLGYTTPALDLELEAEASNADFTTSGKTCWPFWRLHYFICKMTASMRFSSIREGSFP